MLSQPPSNISVGSKEIESRFGTHKATIEGPEATAPKHYELRVKFKEFANYLDEVLPPGKLKRWVFKALETSSMWAHKSIAEKAPLLIEDAPPTYETIDSKKLSEFIASAGKHGSAVGKSEDESYGWPNWSKGMARYEWLKFYAEQATNPELQKLAQANFEIGYRHCWDMTDHDGT